MEGARPPRFMRLSVAGSVPCNADAAFAAEKEVSFDGDQSIMLGWRAPKGEVQEHYFVPFHLILSSAVGNRR